MGIEHFLRFIEEHCPSAYVNVDLLKITQAMGLKLPKRLPQNNPMLPYRQANLCLVIDGESCLDRLYGGFFNDWVCGGQWNRMLQFLHVLLTTVNNHHIAAVVVFNGALEMGRFLEWSSQEMEKRSKVRQILRHVKVKGTPPPKVLWMPPAGLRSCLRMALRHFMVPVIQTTDDHKQEVMTFLRDNDFDAIVGEGAEYAFMEPPRYFSAAHLKLTFRGSWETRELILDEVAKQLNLHPNRFCLFAAMLGNYLVSADELRGFYDDLLESTTEEKRNDYKVIIPAVVAFIRNLASVDDVLALGKFIFRSVADEQERDAKAQRFVMSVQYYMNTTTAHYQEFFHPQYGTAQNKQQQAQAAAAAAALRNPDTADDLDDEQFASEGLGGELHDLKEKLAQPDDEAAGLLEPATAAAPTTLEDQMKQLGIDDELPDSALDSAQTALGELIKSESSSDVSEGEAARRSATPTVAAGEAAGGDAKPKAEKDNVPKVTQIHTHTVPGVPTEVRRMTVTRHHRGQMHPWIFNVLSQAEMKMECYLEEGGGQEFPPGWMVFRPVRQAVYAVLFNLNHKSFLLKQQEDDASPEPEPGKYPEDLTTRVFVKEWIYQSRRNSYQFPEYVPATPLEWKGVPTVQRLWFGQNGDDKKKRLKTFLQCLGADSPLMLNHVHVPQHLLMLCCVLRYMVGYPERQILQRHELDAFLAAAVCPQLMDPNTMQELPLRALSTRGVQLAGLFMQGVEHALFANDACGSPLPWLMCCPWLFFDGKLLQMKLDIAARNHSLVEMCIGDMEQVSRVERMRLAVTEGLDASPAPMTASPRSPTGTQGAPVPAWANFVPPQGPRMPPFGRGMPFPGDWMRRMAAARGRGMMGGRDLFERGGQLEIAGVVVGNWGGAHDKRGRGGRGMSPQITAIGGMQRPLRPPIGAFAGPMPGFPFGRGFPREDMPFGFVPGMPPGAYGFGMMRGRAGPGMGFARMPFRGRGSGGMPKRREPIVTPTENHKEAAEPKADEKEPVAEVPIESGPTPNGE